MKFMKNWKRFWTLSRSSDGFTLVELIVVIAILAILAGVAVPAYSGYIEKANTVADESLLAAINRAYAAACIQSNVDITTLDSITADIELIASGDGWIVNPDSIKPTAVKDAFAQFFAGNENATFKVFENIFFDPNLLGFIADGTLTIAFGDGYITISYETAQKLAVSAFGTNMGSEVLLDRVDYVSRLAASLTGSGNALEQMLMSEDAIAGLADSLGVDVADIEATLAQMATERVKQMTGPEYAGMSEGEKLILANKEILANNAVLQAAKNTQNKTEEELLASMKDTSGLKELVSTDPSSGLSQAAMVYGMYTAYAYSLPEGTDRDTALAAVNDPATLLTSLDDEGFRSYLDTPEAKTDLQGYLSAMDMINSSTENNKDAVSDVLVNGFEDPALLALLQQAMGK